MTEAIFFGFDYCLTFKEFPDMNFVLRHKERYADEFERLETQRYYGDMESSHMPESMSLAHLRASGELGGELTQAGGEDSNSDVEAEADIQYKEALRR